VRWKDLKVDEKTSFRISEHLSGADSAQSLCMKNDNFYEKGC
jgi:hypothetical protein